MESKIQWRLQNNALESDEQLHWPKTSPNGYVSASMTQFIQESHIYSPELDGIS